MNDLDILIEKSLATDELTLADTLILEDYPLNQLISTADQFRQRTMETSFDLSTIMNIKSGACSENFGQLPNPPAPLLY